MGLWRRGSNWFSNCERLSCRQKGCASRLQRSHCLGHGPMSSSTSREGRCETGSPSERGAISAAT